MYPALILATAVAIGSIQKVYAAVLQKWVYNNGHFRIKFIQGCVYKG